MNTTKEVNVTLIGFLSSPEPKSKFNLSNESSERHNFCRRSTKTFNKKHEKQIV